MKTYRARKLYNAALEICERSELLKSYRKRLTRIALKAYPRLKRLDQSSNDPFRTAALMCLRANAIDYSPGRDIRFFDSISEILVNTPEIDCISELKKAVENAETILFVGDQIGGTVLDRLFIEQFPAGCRVIYAVRGAAILNEANYEDALRAGIANVADVISRGTDIPGVTLEQCSDEFQKTFRSAVCVIAKGTDNFETLYDCGKSGMFFLMFVRSDAAAKRIGCLTGDTVVVKGQTASDEPHDCSTDYSHLLRNLLRSDLSFAGRE